MYLSFYNLREKPFEITTDPRFLWFGEKHREALAVLEYGLIENKGFLLLTGDVGTGKTTLINALVNKLDDEVVCVRISDPDLEKSDFYQIIGSGFGMKGKFHRKSVFLTALKKRLLGLDQENRKALLIIDEAQRANSGILEEIRMLSNIEKDEKKLINIFFVGQTELNDILWKEENKALKQRITVNYHLEHLSEEETSEYIRCRIALAGNVSQLFTRRAVREIHSFSKGYPRLINIICDRSLLTGFVREARVINRKIIRECVKELTIPGKRRKKKKESRNAGEIPVRKNRRQWVVWIIILFFLAGMITGGIIFRKKVERLFQDVTSVLSPEKPKSNPSLKPGKKEPEPLKPEVSPRSNTPIREGVAVPSVPAAEIEKKPEKAKPGLPPISMGKIIVRFERNSEKMPKEDMKSLVRVADILKRYTDEKLVVTGYSDSHGEKTYNVQLSKKRAEIVKDFLVTLGIDEERIETRGLGPINPIETNDTAGGRSMNRRVEVEISTPEITGKGVRGND